MTPAGMLRIAKELISTPETWTKGQLARDVNGNAVSSLLPTAVCYCGQGAIKAVACNFYLAQRPAQQFLHQSRPNDYFARFSDFNDYPKTTHADVMAAFDRAIALAEASA